MPSARKLPAVRSAQAAALAALPVAAVVTEARGEKGGARILYANPKFCELTGYRATELVGQNTRLLHGPRTELTLLQRGGSSRESSGEGWLHRKDGAAFFARWDFQSIGGTGRQGGKRVGVFLDISEVNRLREGLLQTHKLSTVGLLTSGVAHDFNNLLSVINGYCEMISGKIAPRSAARKDLDEMHRAGLKASAIARQILEFSRRQEAEVKVINFNTLVREIADILRRVAGETVELELRLASDLGNARIDPTQFQQVLLNLCFNAREAMPSGGHLTIRTLNHEVTDTADHRPAELSAGRYVVMRVTDTGHGIDPGVRGRIFEPFFTTKPEGTGLGLATVRGIIRQYDGHIVVESAPGGGTTFAVFLPETAEAEETPSRQPARQPTTRGTETLLVIEEDDVIRKMIAGILAADGYTVIAVPTAEAATTAIAAAAAIPELVLARSDKPAVVALVRKIHARNPGLRFIGVAAEPPATAFPEFFSGAAAHLPKPFALSKLMKNVRSLLDGAKR